MALIPQQLGLAQTEAVWFSSASVSGLLARLSQQDAQLRYWAINDVTDVLLADTGLLLGSNYQLTRYAFRQLSGILGGGLKVLLPTLAGIAGGRTSPEDAIAIWNRMMLLHFATVSQYRLLVDVGQQLVVGVVGRRQYNTAISDLYLALWHTIQQSHPTHTPWLAFSCYRHLGVWYRQAEPLGVTINELPVYGGVYVRTSDICGTQLRLCPFVSFQRGLALLPVKHERVVRRVAQDYLPQLARAWPQTAAQVHKPETYLTSVNALVAQSLGFPPGASRAQTEARKKSCIQFLRRCGLAQKYGRVVVENALVCGAQRPKDVNFSGSVRNQYSQRTVFDLYTQLAYLAAKFTGSRREVLDRALYKLLVYQIGK